MPQPVVETDIVAVEANGANKRKYFLSFQGNKSYFLAYRGNKNQEFATKWTKCLIFVVISM